MVLTTLNCDPSFSVQTDKYMSDSLSKEIYVRFFKKFFLKFVKGGNLEVSTFVDKIQTFFVYFVPILKRRSLKNYRNDIQCRQVSARLGVQN